MLCRILKYVYISAAELFSRQPEARGICFCQVLFYFFFTGFMPSSGGYGGTPGYLVIEELSMHGPLEGGCRAKNIR